MTTNFTKLNYRQLGDQEFNISDFVKPITKLSIQMNTNENLLAILEKFYSEATNGRPGPVWLDIPLDIQKSMVDKFNPLLLIPSITNENQYDISNVIELLSSAKKPLIIAGNGIRISNSISEFEELIDDYTLEILEIRSDPQGEFPDELIDDMIATKLREVKDDPWWFFDDLNIDYDQFVDIDALTQEAIDTDGYGHYLATYDGEAHEVYDDGDLFYIMRID